MPGGGRRRRKLHTVQGGGGGAVYARVCARCRTIDSSIDEAGLCARCGSQSFLALLSTALDLIGSKPKEDKKETFEAFCENEGEPVSGDENEEAEVKRVEAEKKARQEKKGRRLKFAPDVVGGEDDDLDVELSDDDDDDGEANMYNFSDDDDDLTSKPETFAKYVERIEPKPRLAPLHALLSEQLKLSEQAVGQERGPERKVSNVVQMEQVDASWDPNEQGDGPFSNWWEDRNQRFDGIQQR